MELLLEDVANVSTSGLLNKDNLNELPLYYRYTKFGSKQGSIFVCRVCSYSASNAATLKRHVRIHTGERPFMCSFCGNMFRLKHHLKQHMTVHQKQM